MLEWLMPSTRFRLFALLAFAVAASGGSWVSAAELDPTFGVAGKVITDVSGRYDEIRAIAIQPDGRIVVAGVTGSAPNRDIAIARYTTDGALDRSFGVAGIVTTDFERRDDVAWALVIQRDGRIVVGGESSGDFAVARYNVNGTLDAQFGDEGKVTIEFGGNDRALAVTVQPDGRIVVAGTAHGVAFAIARVDSNGQPDVTFGVTGRLVTGFSGEAAAYAIALRRDGKIVAAGATGRYPDARFAVAQYNVDGSLDGGFGAGGTATIDFRRDARAHALVLRSDDTMVVGGLMNNGSSCDGVFARLTPSGGLDSSFGVAGRLHTDFGGRNFATTLAFRPDGGAIVAGSDDFPPYYDFAIASYGQDGMPDRTFNDSGATLTEFGGSSWINAVAVQPDGKIVAAGYARVSSTADFALVRYQPARTAM